MAQAYDPQLAFKPLYEATAEFNSVYAKQAPFRNVPTSLIAPIQAPSLSGPEPGWDGHLQFFQTPEANKKSQNQGVANLGDYRMFLATVVVPNLVLENRERFGQLMQANATLANQIQYIKYDQWNTSPHGQQNFNAIQVTPAAQMHSTTANTPLTQVTPVANRKIFKLDPTPDGGQFISWLQNSPGPVHQASEIDGLIQTTEVVARAWSLGDMTRNTIRLLQVMWWLQVCNAQLARLGANWTRL